jgi:hypothetical protein
MDSPSGLPPLHPDDVLTQYGVRTDQPPFRRRPRVGVEDGMSLTVGNLTVEEMTPFVTRGRTTVRPGAAVRHTTVARLTAVGFTVTRSRTLKNPNHVVVRYPGEWDDAVAKAFDDSFYDTWGGGQHG